MNYNIYLAGEIHSDWRNELRHAISNIQGVSFTFTAPEENHEKSDSIGEVILGEQPNALYRDIQASKINNLRTQLFLNKADLVVAYFGEEFKQWNTASDASFAVASGKPLILIRPEKLHHPLKELSERANVTVATIEAAAKVLHYTFG
ncbi:YtoQ family protein [Listeria sp. ILCC797]|uniref:YtoQ family protein n=1 Tax=Listeria sp. ILCC797 TaxID=1918333 RepID=UPI000B5900F1|nr:YtoQ family protein [Listeria sp. ILCC797]